MLVAVNKMIKSTGIDRHIAERLVDAEYRTPGRVKDATDSALRKVPGIGQSQLATIREVMPKR